MDRFQLVLRNNLWFGTFSRFEQLLVKHGISTRTGGISDQPFTSLNLGLHTGDEADKVRENRRLFACAVGVEPSHVTTAEQVHGDKVFVVRREHAGCGAEEYSQSIKGVDALITNVPGVPLMLFFADCVPVLIVDPKRRAIALSHAGWKGTVAAIAEKTVMAMASEYGTNPADCIAGIGPSIGQCCYEVDEAVINKLKIFPYWQDLITPKGMHWQLNLWEANRRQLLDAGLASDNVAVSAVCTSCNTDLFFSYRAEKGSTGRIGAVISL